MTDGAIGVVVYGMGRSGTSAVTGLFARAGYYLGEADDLMAADGNNQTGYHENLQILELNEEILEALGGSCSIPRPRTCSEPNAPGSARGWRTRSSSSPEAVRGRHWRSRIHESR